MNHTFRAPRAAALLGLALIACGLHGCGCRPAPQEPPTVIVKQSPTAPVARAQSPTAPPTPQTPTAPAQVQSPTTPPATRPEEADPNLEAEKLAQVKEGMTEIEVMRLLGKPGFLISQNGPNATVYRWSGPGGASLIVRFENGRIVRKNVTNAPHGKPSAAQRLSEQKYAEIGAGMSLDEVLGLIGVEPKSQNVGGDGVTIVRWSDESGRSFTARFENGKLTRKTGFHEAAAKVVAPAEEKVAPEAAAPAKEAPETPSAAPAEAAPAEPTPAPAEEPAADTTEKGRVAVAGKTRREAEGDSKKSSYNPPAKLPAFTHGLRQGSFEIKINNPSDYAVKAGLRADKRGVDVSIPAHGTRSVKVDRGVYAFYFISENDPHKLNSGGSGIDLNSMFATDLQVDLSDTGYNVRVLNAKP